MTKDNQWYKTEISNMIAGLEDNKKLRLIWSFIRNYMAG